MSTKEKLCALRAGGHWVKRGSYKKTGKKLFDEIEEFYTQKTAHNKALPVTLPKLRID